MIMWALAVYYYPIENEVVHFINRISYDGSMKKDSANSTVFFIFIGAVIAAKDTNGRIEKVKNTEVL